ncbi:hypothetical protein ACQ4PT_017677 [Festuca glaucescens]
MAATSHTESCAFLKLSSAPAEYACARRLRHKLLLSYLSQQGLHPTFQSLVRQTDAHLSVEHLRQLVAGGLWGEALDYLARFLPPGAGDDDDDILARPILLFLHTLWAFANIAASTTHATVTSDTHLHDFTVCLSVSHSFVLRTILNLILHKPRFR